MTIYCLNKMNKKMSWKITAILVVLIAFTSTSAFSANECPTLTGKYGCVIKTEGNDQYSELKIEQKSLSTQGQAELVQYSFDYTDIEGDPDVIEANGQGVADRYGWTTHCSKGKLISFSGDVGSEAEIYLQHSSDHSISLIQTLDGKTSLNCPKIE